MCDPSEKSVELTYRRREGRGGDADGQAFRWDWELQFSRSQEGEGHVCKAGDRVELNVQGLK